jgi:two-component system NtrC family sensor kinase
MTTKPVFIVDDSLTVRMDLCDAFSAAGFRVVPCASAQDLRSALANEPPALVVLDVVLPDGDGVELLQEMRKSPRTQKVPIVMLSSRAEVSHRIRGLKRGADEYVGKPYDASYVLGRARALMQRDEQPEGEQQRTILVVDDSVTFREALREALEQADFATLTAASGEEGLRVAAQQRPEAIIVDGVMPGIDGQTFIRRLRLDAALRGVPCVLLTGSEGQDDEAQALDAGADAFVRKEEDISVILARLRAVLRSSSTERIEAASLASPKRILAVDDSPTYLQEVTSMLRDEGYDVVLARSGKAALDMLEVQSVDCILLDVVMPGLSGTETCRRIKELPARRDIPLIMLTAIEDRAAMIEGLSAGADDYISKSSEFGVLKARVRAQIRRKQFEDENRHIRERLMRSELEALEAKANRKLADLRATMVEELQRKNRELEAFSYSVSHDLRAPLRRIDGFSRAVISDYGPLLDERGRDYLGRVCASAQRMTQLIDDLLQLARVGMAELERAPVDLSVIVETLVDELVRSEPDRKVEFVIEKHVIVAADRQLMRVVMDNLIGNAFKFTARADPSRVEFGKTIRDGVVVIFVRDNGAGFDMAHVDKLFRPFKRLHRDDDYPGTGIGLATVQRIIDRHGGRVWAEGREGEGTTISFTVPVPKHDSLS